MPELSEQQRRDVRLWQQVYPNFLPSFGAKLSIGKLPQLPADHGIFPPGYIPMTVNQLAASLAMLDSDDAAKQVVVAVGHGEVVSAVAVEANGANVVIRILPEKK